MYRFRNITRRLTNLVAVFLLVIWQAVFAFSPLLTQKAYAVASADLDQCRNGTFSSPVQCTGAAWVNGNANATQAHFREGDSLPYRMKFGDLSIGAHSVTIQWDTTKGGKHALDYLTTYNRTESTANPCSGIAGCGSPSTFNIPADAGAVNQVPGVFTLFNGTITSVSAYSLSGSYADDSTRSITINFTAANATPVLAWSGHIASQIDWDFGNSASAINGSPYHTALNNLDGGGGSQDRSLSADAVAPTPTMTTQVSNSAVTVGQTVTDLATLAGPSNNSPAVTGTVLFFVCGPSGTNPLCTTGGTQVGGAIAIASNQATSSPYTVTTDGKYCFRAEYLPASNAPYSPQNHTNQTTECFTATPRPSSITIKKNAIPDDSQLFHYSTSGLSTDATGFDLADDSTSGLPEQPFSNLSAGSYTITENATPGWDFDGVSCSGAINSTIDKNGAQISITLVAGEDIVCTYTNHQRGTITVHKVTDPANDTTPFTVTAETDNGNIAGNPIRTNLATDNSVVYDVSQGTYNVNESDIAGWAENDNDCQGLVINSTNLTVECSIINTKFAKLKIIKEALSVNESDLAQDFSFTTIGTGLSSFSLDDDNDATLENEEPFTNLLPGDYSVTEGVTTGWTLTGIDCPGHAFSRPDDTDKLEISLAAGEDVACKFTNTKHGSISGFKYEVDADGIGTLGIVDWTIYLLLDGKNYDSTPTGANGSYAFNDLLPGIYTLLEDVTDPNYTQIYPLPNSILVTLEAGQNDTEGNNFGNFENGSVSGYKWNDINGDGQKTENEPKLSGWTIRLLRSSDNTDGNYVEVATTPTDVNGNYSFTNLSPLPSRFYAICEVQQTGWVQTSPLSNACRYFEINLSDESNTGRNFGNQGRGNIVVDKVTLPTEDPESFDFTTTGNDYEEFSLTDTSEPNDQELAAGSYSVAEDTEDGWDLTDVECLDGDTQVDSSNITLEAGRTVTCTFTNTKQATVNVTKYNDYNLNGTLDEGEPTLEGWEMFLEHLNNGDLGPNSETTNGEGVATYENVVPGSYGLSENLASQEGWNFSDIDCDQVDGRLDDNNTLIFSVSPGQVVDCSVGNYQDLEMTLVKDNNRPAPTTVGDTVTYTLTLTLPTTSGASFNTQVIDLPPEGFEYVAGSWTATKNGLPIIVADPAYGSPGTWLLGTLLPGDTVVMTYRALITSGVNAGTYPDLAFASGCDVPLTGDVECGAEGSGSNAVLANASSPDPFVATNVTVAVGQVLAANVTRTLFKTGTETILVQAFSALMLAIGLALGIRTYRTKEGGTK